MKKSILILSLLFSAQSFAVNKLCTDDSFSFTGDKQSHLLYSASLGLASRAVIKDPWVAFGVALLPGIHRELFHPHSCFSKEDMFYNILGAGLSVSTEHFILGPNKVIFHMEF